MDQAPPIKDDRVLPLNVNDRVVWIVRFKNDLFLQKAFDSDAELLEALGADDRAATAHIRTDSEVPWGVIELLLNGEPLYAVYNGTNGKMGSNGTRDLEFAKSAARRLNQRLRPPRHRSNP